MTRMELVAILPGAGPPEGHAGCRIVEAGNHAAVLRAAPLLRPVGRRAALAAAADQARLLEGLMAFGTVLPVLPGQRLREAEVPDLLAANRPTLERLAQRLVGRVQYQVTVRWAADRALARFSRSVETGPAEAATADLACDLRGRIEAELDVLGAEILALPVAGEVIANHALLVDRAAEAALDAAIERIDAIWSEGFAIRVVGPYPAVSFASLAFDRVGAAAVRAAQAALALDPHFTPGALRLARRRAMIAAPPEAVETLRWQAEVLACAERLGRGQGPVHVARIWSEGMSAGAARQAEAA